MRVYYYTCVYIYIYIYICGWIPSCPYGQTPVYAYIGFSFVYPQSILLSRTLRMVQISLLYLCATLHYSNIDESCIKASRTPIFLANYIIVCKTQYCVFMSTSYTIAFSIKKSFTYLFHLETLLAFPVTNKLVYIEELLTVFIPSGLLIRPLPH